VGSAPDGISNRYRRMAENLGIDTHVHALRHYGATELLSSGVDLRTVAGQLGPMETARRHCASTPLGSARPIKAPPR
jgi:site-specific recombinase XerD